MPHTYSPDDCSGRYESFALSWNSSLTGLFVALCSDLNSSAVSGAHVPLLPLPSGMQRADDRNREPQADDAADRKRGLRHESATSDLVGGPRIVVGAINLTGQRTHSGKRRTVASPLAHFPRIVRPPSSPVLLGKSTDRESRAPWRPLSSFSGLRVT